MGQVPLPLRRVPATLLTAPEGTPILLLAELDALATRQRSCLCRQSDGDEIELHAQLVLHPQRPEEDAERHDPRAVCRTVNAPRAATGPKLDRR